MNFKITVDDWELDFFPIPDGVKLERVFGSMQNKWRITRRGQYLATSCYDSSGFWSLRFHGRETRFRKIPNLKRAIIYAVANHGEFRNNKRKG